MRRSVSCLAVLLLLPSGSSAEGLGVVVEEVGGGAAREAGVTVGDEFLSWRRAGAGGPLTSPFEALRVETEEAPFGPVTLLGSRHGEPLEVILTWGRWQLETRPVLDDRELEDYRRALAAIASDGAAEEVVALRRLAGAAGATGDSECEAWLLLRAGSETAAWETAAAFFAAASAAVRDDPLVTAWTYELAGEEARKRRKLEDAVHLHREALRLRRQASGDSMVTARSLYRSYAVARSRRDLEAARDFAQEALAIRQRLAPRSLETAAILNSLGTLNVDQGELAAGEELMGRAAVIAEELQPNGLQFAASLNNLGVVLKRRGSLAAAEEHHRRALEIESKLAPGSPRVAANLNNLAVLAHSRGDLAAAEHLLQQSLAIKESLQPGGLGVAASLNNLGMIALARDELDAAETYYSRALAIKEALAPGSLEVASTLNNLGELGLKRHDGQAAEGYFRRSLAIKQAVGPGETGEAYTLTNLAAAASERDDLEGAESLHHRALAILDEVAPGGLLAATNLYGLGSLAAERGDLSAAEAQHRRTLELRQRLAPGSADEASSHWALGKVLRKSGRRQEALASLEAAMDALEAQGSRLGGSRESLATFRVRFADLYREAIDLLLELSRPEEAFHVLERSRARGLLAMMAERDLVLGDVPAELEERRRRTDAEHSRTVAELAQVAAVGDDDRREELRRRLEELRQEQHDVRSRIRAASPRVAALRYPQPLNLAGVREELEEGTLLLAYSLAPSHGVLFAVGPGVRDFAVFRLDLDEESLRDEIEQLRSVLQRRAPRSSTTRAKLLARRLSATLLAPAAEPIGRARRLLILPDGALFQLPFGALLDPADDTRSDRWLVESKPLAVVASATVLGELRAPRAQERKTRLAAFGDPVYPGPAAAASAPKPATANQSGLELRALPATRQEVIGIGRLYGEAADVWLGGDATEERVLALSEEVSIVHLAVHGTLDDRFPLESAVVLSIPPEPKEDQANGLLQAWEILEGLRLDADLVTLSACDTGLGKETAGEGILGLTRAFQFAGARSVVASLWQVADDSTAALMERFYGHLTKGLGVAESMRSAQLELIRAPVRSGAGRRIDASHPYHWAAFQVFGDWR